MPDEPIRDANGYDYNDYPAARMARERKVLNQSWPPADVARRLKDKEPEDCIEVTVRLELEQDGEVHLDGTATRWHGQHVFVANINDPRIKRGFAWVDARDVKRR